MKRAQLRFLHEGHSGCINSARQATQVAVLLIEEASVLKMALGMGATPVFCGQNIGHPWPEGHGQGINKC